MKARTDFDRTMSITSHDGGFITNHPELGGRKTKIHMTFEQAVNELARAFCLVNIGERVVISATTEWQETAKTEREGEK